MGVKTHGVPEPVGRGRQSDTTRADGQREDLANDDPRARTPGGGEEEDEDGDEGDLGVDGGDVVGDAGVGIGRARVGVVEADGDTDDGDKELADQHAQSTPDEQGATAEALDGPEGEGRAAHVDQGEDERDQERVLDRASRLQEGSRVVEDEVDTGPLLHHLQRGTQDGAAQVRLLMAETALEAVGPGVEPAGVGDDGALVLLVGHDLGQFDLDVFRVTGLASQFRQRDGRVLETALLDEVSWRVGESHETERQDESPCELDGNGDSVGASVTSPFGGVDND